VPVRLGKKGKKGVRGKEKGRPAHFLTTTDKKGFNRGERKRRATLERIPTDPKKRERKGGVRQGFFLMGETSPSHLLRGTLTIRRGEKTARP